MKRKFERKEHGYVAPNRNHTGLICIHFKNRELEEGVVNIAYANKKGECARQAH